MRTLIKHMPHLATFKATTLHVSTLLFEMVFLITITLWVQELLVWFVIAKLSKDLWPFEFISGGWALKISIMLLFGLDHNSFILIWLFCDVFFIHHFMKDIELKNFYSTTNYRIESIFKSLYLLNFILGILRSVSHQLWKVNFIFSHWFSTLSKIKKFSLFLHLYTGWEILMIESLLKYFPSENGTFRIWLYMCIPPIKSSFSKNKCGICNIFYIWTLHYIEAFLHVGYPIFYHKWSSCPNESRGLRRWKTALWLRQSPSDVPSILGTCWLSCWIKVFYYFCVSCCFPNIAINIWGTCAISVQLSRNLGMPCSVVWPDTSTPISLLLSSEWFCALWFII